jgi:hypothetical protein
MVATKETGPGKATNPGFIAQQDQVIRQKGASAGNY